MQKFSEIMQDFLFHFFANSIFKHSMLVQTLSEIMQHLADVWNLYMHLQLL